MASAEELRQLSEQANHFPPTTTDNRERRPSTFLSLAPKTSESYPRTQKPAAPLTAEALAEATKAQEEAHIELMKRRTSSLSSDGSKSRLRFLKLGPVHWGEHQDDHKGDWHEVAVDG
ncbi:hypothetical protein QBC46DRAFT_253493 [Diplogelasinospora grovesii]|uniref:Uncharacterized protein n=1 Tax=Diplogelasinospora grovesii TaxID=303347 RepID=A0AAN6NHE1_9PEZI|nr:hypothetical protein QBC46DRAFT_253493 [Diplogelasinospora grovesii]